MTPTISTYAYLWKQHSYIANPFAPLGCKVEAHLCVCVYSTSKGEETLATPTFKAGWHSSLSL